MLDRRPTVAGIPVGLLIYKPQFGNRTLMHFCGRIRHSGPNGAMLGSGPRPSLLRPSSRFVVLEAGDPAGTKSKATIS
jgi:hypothetical protein